MGTDERHALDVFVSEQASVRPAPGPDVRARRRLHGRQQARPRQQPLLRQHRAVRGPKRHRRASTSPTGWRRNINGPPAPRTSAPPCAGWPPTSPSHGGDPARVVLMGHSAGAVHAATYVANPKFHGPRGVGLVGRDPRLGPLRFLQVRSRARPRRPISARMRPSAPRPRRLRCCRRRKVRLMVVYGELDPAQFVEQAKLMGAALCKAQPLLEPAAPAQAQPHVRGLRHQHARQVAERRDPRVREGREVVSSRNSRAN